MGKKNLKDRLKKKREELARKGQGGHFFFFPEGTTRLRPLPVGDDEDFAFEVTYFYLGPDIKGVVSPSSFGDPCGILEAYKELKDSKDEDDRELAKSFSPKKRYVMPHIRYKDEKGKDVDHEAGAKLALLNNGQYQDVIDTYLDEEYGDFTDIKEGYDIKYVRTGTTQYDTKYTLRPCKSSKLSKKYKGKLFNPEEMLRKVVPTYEETRGMAATFLGVDVKKKKNKKKGKKDKKK